MTASDVNHLPSECLEMLVTGFKDPTHVIQVIVDHLSARRQMGHHLIQTEAVEADLALSPRHTCLIIIAI